MEVNSCNIQVLLQAAEYLERRERGITGTVSFLFRLHRARSQQSPVCVNVFLSVQCSRTQFSHRLIEWDIFSAEIRCVLVQKWTGSWCWYCCVWSGDLHFSSVLYTKARNRHRFENVAALDVILMLLQCINFITERLYKVRSYATPFFKYSC